MNHSFSNNETAALPKPNKYRAVQTVHHQEPDFSRPLFELSPEVRQRIAGRLEFLYGDETARKYMVELERICQVYYAHKPLDMIERDKTFIPEERFTEEDLILITYGDLVQGDEPSPLATLARFCDDHFNGAINTLHILPFFPFSSDRGFSIIDFKTVDPNLGSWHDIEDLEGRYQLMFDGVINHVSSKSEWFREFLNGNPLYKDFFTAYDSPDDLTPEQRRLIFRPRTSDILSHYQSIKGPVYVWTTFSADQVDLNFQNPNVLLRVIEVILCYVRHGADIIRLDAVTYLWDEPGTTGIHLDQTHEIVKLMRDVLDTVTPGVALITETNVPHAENISYFGNGHDEAHMVYNFALPPLVLHTFYREDVTALSNWARSLSPPSKTTSFFNFLDSHDGVGLMAVKDILSREDIDYIVRQASEHGGLISYKAAGDGTEEPYELNITWFSALNKEGADEDLAFQAKRFVASRSIALVLQGVPGIYLHGLIGTSNDIKAVLETQSKRAINRTVIKARAIEDALKDPRSKLSHIDRGLGALMAVRAGRRAFHPNGEQRVLSISTGVFTVLRISPEGDQSVLCLTNVTDNEYTLRVPRTLLESDKIRWYDLVGQKTFEATGESLNITMQPYDVMWLEPAGQ